MWSEGVLKSGVGGRIRSCDGGTNGCTVTVQFVHEVGATFGGGLEMDRG